MDELRLILLGVGALLVAGVYLYSRFSQGGNGGENRGRTGAPDEEETAGQSNRMHDDEIDDDLPSLHLDGSSERAARTEAASPQHDKTGEVGDPAYAARNDSRNDSRAGKEKLVVLNIFPVEQDGRFRGNDLLEVFDRAGLEYGRFDVFHRMVETPDGLESVFSVASATEPGSFEISEMADESFKGLTMFMLLPGPQGGVAAFADMLATARRMAQQLNADVTDRNRSTMTRQTAHHVREDIIAFEHQFRSESGHSR